MSSSDRGEFSPIVFTPANEPSGTVTAVKPDQSACSVVTRRIFAMSMSRRKFTVSLASAIPGFLLINPHARAAEFNWKASTSVAADHPLNVRLTEAAKRMAEQSGGKVDLKIFPSAQLGGDVDVLSQTLSGAVSFQMI